jgi:hypothetical protein
MYKYAMENATVSTEKEGLNHKGHEGTQRRSGDPVIAVIG